MRTPVRHSYANERRARSSLVAQGFRRIELGGALGGEKSKSHADGEGDAEGHDDGPRGNGDLDPVRDKLHTDRNHQADHDSDRTAYQADENGFDQKLQQDFPA